MTRKKSFQQASPQTQEEAFKIARATQRPGQTKEQTKLIAQGIQKGIEQYKKQQKAKSRARDKKLKQAQKQQPGSYPKPTEITGTIVYKYTKLPWILLSLSWIIFVAYYCLKL